MTAFHRPRTVGFLVALGTLGALAPNVASADGPVVAPPSKPAAAAPSQRAATTVGTKIALSKMPPLDVGQRAKVKAALQSARQVYEADKDASKMAKAPAGLSSEGATVYAAHASRYIAVKTSKVTTAKPGATGTQGRPSDYEYTSVTIASFVEAGCKVTWVLDTTFRNRGLEPIPPTSPDPWVFNWISGGWAVHNLRTVPKLLPGDSRSLPYTLERERGNGCGAFPDDWAVGGISIGPRQTPYSVIIRSGVMTIAEIPPDPEFDLSLLF